MRKIPLFILIFMILELVALIRVGASIGAFNTVLLFIFSSVIGLMIVRWQGAATAIKVGRKLSQGFMPKQEIAQSMMIVVAGIFLILPGFITDTLGAVLFIAGMANIFIQRFLREKSPSQYHTDSGEKTVNESQSTAQDSPRGNSAHQGRSGTTIDGEYRRED